MTKLVELDTFYIPVTLVPAIVNGDVSGLSDEEERKLNKFIDRLTKRHGAITWEFGEDKFFIRNPDIINLGSDCVEGTAWIDADTEKENNMKGARAIINSIPFVE